MPAGAFGAVDRGRARIGRRVADAVRPGGLHRPVVSHERLRTRSSHAGARAAGGDPGDAAGGPHPNGRRRRIKATVLRSTSHMVSAGDYWPMEVGVRGARREWWLRVTRSQYGRIDPDAMAQTVHAQLAAGPLRQKELSRRLSVRGGEGSQAGISILADIVRVPPSGTWDQRRADLYGLAADW